MEENNDIRTNSNQIVKNQIKVVFQEWAKIGLKISAYLISFLIGVSFCISAINSSSLIYAPIAGVLGCIFIYAGVLKGFQLYSE